MWLCKIVERFPLNLCGGLKHLYELRLSSRWLYRKLSSQGMYCSIQEDPALKIVCFVAMIKKLSISFLSAL
jgi:hypothetical protein